jgi:hypothetical protein
VFSRPDVLFVDQLLYYNGNPARVTSAVDPKGSISLAGASIVTEQVKPTAARFPFKVSTPGGQCLVFATDTFEQRSKWVKDLQVLAAEAKPKRSARIAAAGVSSKENAAPAAAAEDEAETKAKSPSKRELEHAADTEQGSASKRLKADMASLSLAPMDTSAEAGADVAAASASQDLATEAAADALAAAPLASASAAADQPADEAAPSSWNERWLQALRMSDAAFDRSVVKAGCLARLTSEFVARATLSARTIIGETPAVHTPGVV